MDTIADPRVAATQWFKDEQRLSQCACPLNRSLQAEVPAGAPEGDHPVQNKLTLSVGVGVVSGSQTERWYFGVHSSLQECSDAAVSPLRSRPATCRLATQLCKSDRSQEWLVT